MTNNYKTYGGNTKLMKKINRQLILNAIFEKPDQSSADIARKYKLQRSTVTNIVNELIKEGHVRVSGVGQSTKGGGKPPTLLELNPEHGYIIGVEILPLEIRLILMNYKSDVLFRERYNYKQPLNKDTLIPQIVENIKKLKKEYKLKDKNILGMGLGISGLVNYDEGQIYYSMGLKVKNFPVVKRLKEHFKFPIYIDNDANVAAIAEQWFGKAKNLANIVFVSINEEVTGVGCGLVFDYELYRGTSRSAGELPFRLPTVTEILKEEGYPEYRNIEKEAKQQNKNIIQFLCQNPDADWAKIVFARLGRLLGEEITRIIHFVNPEIVILGGEISNTAEYLIEPINAHLNEHVLEIPRKTVNITTTSFGLFAVSVGAAVLVFKKLFKTMKNGYRIEQVTV